MSGLVGEREGEAARFSAMKLKSKGTKRKIQGVAAAPAHAPDIVVSIGSAGLKSLKPRAKEVAKVIAAQANSWQLHGSRQAAAQPTSSTLDADRSNATAPVQTLDEEAVAALVHDASRRNGDGGNDEKAEKLIISGGGITETSSGSQLGAKLQELKDAAAVSEPDLTANGGIVNEDDKYRADVAWRPREAAVTADTWDAMPIAQFGSALLRGMGWKPGKAIGLNAKGPAAAVEYVPRHHRLGLGATPKAPEPKKKGWINKPGESRGPKDEMIYRNEDGVQRHRKTVDEKLVKRETLGIGSTVAIVGGKHEGLQGVLSSLQEMSGFCQVTLGNDEEVNVAMEDLVLLSKWLAQQAEATDRRGSDIKEKKRHKAKHKKEKHKKKVGRDVGGCNLWVASGLRVRIVSKSFADGRYYNKKAIVQDVQSKRDILLQMSDGTLCDGCPQKALETVVPRPGGSGGAGNYEVMVLAGRERGKRAAVLSRDTKANKVTVQLEHDSSTLLALTMGQVCEWPTYADVRE